MYPKNMPHRKAKRALEAQDRKEAREGRTPAQQLARLDELLGKDLGARKERAKLTKLQPQPEGKA